MLIDSVRVSKQARDQLITLRRRTGIENWNVVCRWAFCASLAEPSKPRNQKIVTDSNVEMTWHTFAGVYEQVYEALLRHRCRQDDVEPTPEAMAQQLKLHLHRGISYLAGDPKVNGIAGLARNALSARERPRSGSEGDS